MALIYTLLCRGDGQVSEIIKYYPTGEPEWRVKKCVDAECSKVRCVDGECSKVTWYAKTTYYNKTGEALSTTHYIQEDLIQEDLKNLNFNPWQIFEDLSGSGWRLNKEVK